MYEMFITERSFILSLLIEGIFLVLCCLLSGFQITLYISLLVLFVFLVNISFRQPHLYLKYFILFFYLESVIIGTSLIELIPNRTLSEIGSISHFTGSVPLLCFLFWIMIIAVIIFDSLYKNDSSMLDNNIHWSERTEISNTFYLLSFISLLLNIMLFLRVFKHPAFMLKIDRFEYNKLFPAGKITSILGDFASYLMIFTVTASIIKKRGLSILSICIFVLYCLWTGNKFGPFFTLLVQFCLLLYLKVKSHGIHKIQKTFHIILIILIALTVFAIILNSVVFKYSPFNYLFNRLSQQGQLWWKIYDLYKRDSPHILELTNEIKAFFEADGSIQQNIGSNFGIYKIMYLTTPASIINSKLASGSRYTQAGFASAYYYGGFVGATLFSISIGLLFALFTNKLLESIKKQDAIKTYIYWRFIGICRTIFGMFLFYELSGKRTILTILILFVLSNKKKPYDVMYPNHS